MSDLFIDTETTGLNPETEDLLQVAIVDDQGKVLLNVFVQPTKRTEWPEAQAIHGITPEMAAEGFPLHVVGEWLQNIIKGHHLIAYNMNFDHSFIKPLLGELIEGEDYFAQCAMTRYAYIKGEWDEKRQHFRWHKLAKATQETGYQWQGTAHQAVHDADACRHVWKWCEAHKLAGDEK